MQAYLSVHRIDVGTGLAFEEWLSTINVHCSQGNGSDPSACIKGYQICLGD